MYGTKGQNTHTHTYQMVLHVLTWLLSVMCAVSKTVVSKLIHNRLLLPKHVYFYHLDSLYSVYNSFTNCTAVSLLPADMSSLNDLYDSSCLGLSSSTDPLQADVPLCLYGPPTLSRHEINECKRPKCILHSELQRMVYVVRGRVMSFVSLCFLFIKRSMCGGERKDPDRGYNSLLEYSVF